MALKPFIAAWRAVATPISRGLEVGLDRLFHVMGRWIPFLPEDVFISYARADGGRYARRLATMLGAHNLNCIMDVFAADVGQQIPPNLIHALRRARQLVVVGTEGSVRSEGVAWEVEHFPREGRSVVIIGLCDEVKRAPWMAFLPGFDAAQESQDRLADADPSPGIVETILAAYQFKTQRQRLAIFAVGVFLGIGAVTVVGAATAGVFWLVARDASQQAADAKTEVTRLGASIEKAKDDLIRQEENLRNTTERLTSAQRSLRLTEARRTALELERRRREQSGYSAPSDVIKALGIAPTLADLGAPDEAEVVLREGVRLLPGLQATFHVAPKAPRVLAGDPARLFVATGNDVRVLDPLSGRELEPPRKHEARVRKMLAVGTGLLVTTEDESVTLWHPALSLPRRVACSGKSQVRAATVDAYGNRLAIACDRRVELMRLQANAPNSMPPLPIASTIDFDPWSLHIGPYVDIMLAVNRTGLYDPVYELRAFRLIDGAMAQKLTVDPRCSGGRGEWVTVSGDGTRIVSSILAGNNGERTYRVCPRWSVGQARIEVDEVIELRMGRTENEGEPRNFSFPWATFSGAGGYVLARPTTGANAWLFDSRPAETIGVWPWSGFDLDLSFSGDLVTLVTDKGDVQTWKTRPIYEAMSVEGAIDRLWMVAADAVAIRLRTDEFGRTQQLKVLQFPSGRLQWSCDRPSAALQCTPDDAPGSKLALEDLAYRPGFGWVGLERVAGEYRASRLAPRKILHRWKADAVYRLSADGGLAISSELPRRVFDLLGARPLETVQKDRRQVIDALRGPKGLLEVVSSNRCPQLVDGDKTYLVTGIDECAGKFVISQDGHFLVVAGTRSVGVWDVIAQTWRARRRVPADVRGVAISPDQRTVAISTTNRGTHRVTLWRWLWDDVQREACRVLDQSLAAAQWEKLVSRDELTRACGSLTTGARELPQASRQ